MWCTNQWNLALATVLGAVLLLTGCGDSSTGSGGDGTGGMNTGGAGGTSGTGGTEAMCTVAGDCRLFSSNCGDCFCVALGADEPDPPCDETIVECIVDPCSEMSVGCVGGECVPLLIPD